MDPDSTAPARRRSGRKSPVRPRAGLTVVVTDGRGRAVGGGGLGRWLTRVAPRGAHGELGVALVTDARMRVLNRSYRKQDYATDVLSFPNSDPRTHGPTDPRTQEPTDPRTHGPKGPRTQGPTDPLGDIVIATGVAARQAREAGHPLPTELRILALHGLLHLLGYDHDDPADNGRMARAEARLLRKGGVKSGLIERAASRTPHPARRTSQPRTSQPRSSRSR